MRMPTLEFNGNTFLFHFNCATVEKHVPLDAGFDWSRANGCWTTKDSTVAARLREYAKPSAERQLKRTLIDYSPWLMPLPSPPRGLRLKPHQPEAVYFALDRNRSYLGLDAGLGKTIVAAIVAAALECPVVYISPPFLVLNVEEEFQKWVPNLEVGVVGQGPQPDYLDVLIIPDSLIARDSIRRGIRKWIGKHGAALIVDEAHRFKNTKAQRTAALFGRQGNRVRAAEPGIVDLFERQIFMSGTPMPNRPMELYPILSHAAPATIDHFSEFEFGRKYCAGKRGRFGWDFGGASNVKELAKRVIHPSGPFMLRQKKALLKLPPITEEVFVLSAGMSPRLATMNKGLGERYANIEDLVKKRLAKKDGKDDIHTATYRRLLGLEKVKPACEYIGSIMEETEDVLLVYAFHIEVIEKLAHRLAKFAPLVITGSTSKKQRHLIVKEFQASKKRRPLIGNYQAMGIGFTLTRANRVLFTEFSWVPGDNSQAADRAHRIGQERSVLMQYAVYKDSLDKAVIETLLRKRNAIQHV